MVQEHDEPILNHLEDIKGIYFLSMLNFVMYCKFNNILFCTVIMLEKDPMGFVLEFQFSPNEYFTNSVLTKEYNMKCQPDHDHPFDFEGPEIHKCIVSIFNYIFGIRFLLLFFVGLLHNVV